LDFFNEKVIIINIREIQDKITKSIISTVVPMLGNLKFNRTEYGKITSILENYRYGVTINEIESKIYAIDNKTFIVGDILNKKVGD
jgi:hypothetical protein